jgi:hypothetical protein
VNSEAQWTPKQAELIPLDRPDRPEMEYVDGRWYRLTDPVPGPDLRDPWSAFWYRDEFGQKLMTDAEAAECDEAADRVRDRLKARKGGKR